MRLRVSAASHNEQPRNLTKIYATFRADGDVSGGKY